MRPTLPVPMMNVLNGGAHADNKVDFQEFMIVPAGAPSFADAVRMGAEVFQALKATLKQRGLGTTVGDEGGFAPDLESNEAALEVLLAGIEAAGYEPGSDILIALDPATSELYEDGTYVLEHEGRSLSAGGAGRLLGGDLRRPSRWSRSRTAWTRRTGTAGRRSPSGSGTVSSSSGTTSSSPTRSACGGGSSAGVANSILVKLNQIGTLTETLETIAIAHDAGYTTVISHRSGETEDTTIADLAVATGRRADQDRRPVALGSDRQVQPAAAHRGGAGGARDLPGSSAPLQESRAAAANP